MQQAMKYVFTFLLFILCFILFCEPVFWKTHFACRKNSPSHWHWTPVGFLESFIDIRNESFSRRSWKLNYGTSSRKVLWKSVQGPSLVCTCFIWSLSSLLAVFYWKKQQHRALLWWARRSRAKWSLKYWKSILNLTRPFILGTNF